MTHRVVWSPTSRADLIRIAKFIARDNPSAARSVIERIRAEGEALGKTLVGRPGRVSGTYEKVLSRLPYIIAYELLPEGGDESVAVLHVIHTRRNWRAEEWPKDS